MTRTRQLSRGGDWILSAKAHSTSVSPDRTRVYSFDLEGRPLSWWERGRTYKRSLASVVHVRERKAGRRRHRVLPPEEAAGRFRSLLRVVERAPAGLLDPELRERVARILAWTPAALDRERERFEAVYRPIGILPPDQYLSVVLQATFGCSWNRCTFCDFYQDETFRTRSRASFERHCDAVRDLLGAGLSLRRSIFLASGNSLVLSNERLLPLMRAARERFPDKPVAGFVDVFTGERKRADAWRELRDRGLERVHVGLETGHDPLLARLNKPGNAEAADALIRTLKRAGLRVFAIVMVGVGGARFAGEHVRDTIGLLARLPLTGGDAVYLSPFRAPPGSEYARRASGEAWQPLDPQAADAQYETLRGAIVAAHPALTVARYDIREFVY